MEEVVAVPGTHAGDVDRPSVWPWLVPVAALVAGALLGGSTAPAATSAWRR